MAVFFGHHSNWTAIWLIVLLAFPKSYQEMVCIRSVWCCELCLSCPWRYQSEPHAVRMKCYEWQLVYWPWGSHWEVTHQMLYPCPLCNTVLCCLKNANAAMRSDFFFFHLKKTTSISEFKICLSKLIVDEIH